MSIDRSSERGGSRIVCYGIFASWEIGECTTFADGDGDFGGMRSGLGFRLGTLTGTGGVIFGMDGNAGGGFCIIGCVDRVDLVIVR